MSMIIGQAYNDPVTGMAGRIYDYIVTELHGQTAGSPSVSLLPTPINATARKFYAALAQAVAAGVIDEIHSNGQVSGPAIL